jgi:hypothetical protein
MGTLARTILMRRVGSSRFHMVASLLKQFHNLTTTTKVTATIHPNVLLNRGIFTTIKKEPAIEEVNRRLLGRKTLSPKTPTVMINNQNVARFTIEAGETTDAIAIGGRVLDHETVVTRDALTTHRGMTGVIRAASSFAELGLGTDGAHVKVSSNGDLRHVVGTLVHLGEAPEVHMAKPLVPNHAELVASQATEDERLVRIQVLILRGLENKATIVRKLLDVTTRVSSRISISGTVGIMTTLAVTKRGTKKGRGVIRE